MTMSGDDSSFTISIIGVALYSETEFFGFFFVPDLGLVDGGWGCGVSDLRRACAGGATVVADGSTFLLSNGAGGE